mmetsp:Transcript_12974/g.24784  ORF Transcript_12974/g.24784 Transcript_12974/m.24784 type:complete len:134 (+) Transcript_12974:240-641(+)
MIGSGSETRCAIGVLDRPRIFDVTVMSQPLRLLLLWAVSLLKNLLVKMLNLLYAMISRQDAGPLGAVRVVQSYILVEREGLVSFLSIKARQCSSKIFLAKNYDKFRVAFSFYTIKMGDDCSFCFDFKVDETFD